MTPNHLRFYAMLDQVPQIAHLWDREDHSLKVDLFEQELAVMSSGEVLLAQFFAAVWFNKMRDKYVFDLVSGINSLDMQHRELIAE